MVEYSADVFILRPVVRSKGNRRLFYEINNRGVIRSLGLMNDVAALSNIRRPPKTRATAS